MFSFQHSDILMLAYDTMYILGEPFLITCLLSILHDTIYIPLRIPGILGESNLITFLLVILHDTCPFRASRIFVWPCLADKWIAVIPSC